MVLFKYRREKTTMSFKTRESWLNAAAKKLAATVFVEAALVVPEELKVSCGWPTHHALAGAKGRVIGQCFKKECSTEGHSEIFISPVLADPIEVLTCLVHEMVHAVDNCVHRHGPLFKKMAHACGLIGKATETKAGDELAIILKELVNELGEYPHSALDVSKQAKKQTTRLIKASCVTCGYTIRVTRSWINQAIPNCPLCGVEFYVEDSE
jgi:hypothetical protein